jgi:Mrp family chromosome partitioning ATPase
MSKNFELLRQAQREKGLLDRAFSAAASNSKMHEVLRQANRGQDLLETAVTAKPFALEHPQTPPSRYSREETFKLIQRLFLANRQGAPQMVVFCGVADESEYGWICARSAEHLSSQVKGSVCVVDANLPHPSLHAYYKVDGSRGLCDALRESKPAQNFIQRIGTGNLWLLPAGSAGANLSLQSLVRSDRLRPLLADLRTEFDYVLIDAAPMAAEQDFSFLAAQTDGVILVMEPNSTSSKMAQKAKQDLQAASARVLGVVFNERPWTAAQKFAELRTNWRKAIFKR